MALVSGQNIQLAFGGEAIFHDFDFRIDKGERLCVLGRNGAGKSTFFKLLTRELVCDKGDLNFQKNIKIALMDQSVPEGSEESCYQIIASGLKTDVRVLTEYQRVLQQLETDTSEAVLEDLQRLQNEVDSKNLWDADHQIQKAASLLNIDTNNSFASLSGGRKRRAWLARALVSEPDILLLDEPTNHIDLDTVLWLEKFLLNWPGTLVFISHDRSFISHLATRIIDIDRGQASSWPGDYALYLEKKQESLEVEIKHNKLFDKKLAQEEVWIRQGVKARRTRNEGRVRALYELRNQHRARREQQGSASFKIAAADKSSKVVIEAKGLTFHYDDGQCILNNFDTLILRGDKIGIIGPNGVGKSTLVKLLLGQIKAQAGSLKVAENLQIAYFDQLRESLIDHKSIRDNVAEGSDFIELDGHKTHIISYLKEFLFSAERLNTPLSALSGGERNRVLLAKLFSKPSNFLVLDEPTNDLDIDTLELLEEKLLAYPGTLILISHDRSFLNNIVTSTIVFENDTVNEYVGGYDDWLSQRGYQDTLPKVEQKRQSLAANIGAGNAATASASATQKPMSAKKLSYKEKQEYESLPLRIENLEKELQILRARLADPGIYQSGGQEANALAQKLEKAEQDMEQAYERWAILDGS